MIRCLGCGHISNRELAKVPRLDTAIATECYCRISEDGVWESGCSDKRIPKLVKKLIEGIVGTRAVFDTGYKTEVDLKLARESASIIQAILEESEILCELPEHEKDAIFTLFKNIQLGSEYSYKNRAKSTRHHTP